MYPEHERLVIPAEKARSSIGHLIAGCVLVLALTYVLTSLWVDMAVVLMSQQGNTQFFDELFYGSTPAAMMVLLFSFVIWPLTTVITLHWVHRRAFAPVIGAQAFAQFKQVFKGLVLLNIVMIILPPWDGGLPDGLEMVPNMAADRWLLLLPVSILAVLVQVSAEEILFRGYLQQQLAALSRSRFVWMALPSLIFGVAHYDASAGSNAWFIVIWACIFGALMADLTARAGSLGPAIAVHFVNNALAILLVGVPDNMDGLALYTIPGGLEDEATIRAMLEPAGNCIQREAVHVVRYAD